MKTHVLASFFQLSNLSNRTAPERSRRPMAAGETANFVHASNAAFTRLYKGREPEAYVGAVIEVLDSESGRPINRIVIC